MLCYSDLIIGFGQDKLRPWSVPVVLRVGRDLRSEIWDRKILKLWEGSSHRKMPSIEDFRVAWPKQEGEADVCNSVFNNSVPNVQMAVCRLSQLYRSVMAENCLRPKLRLLWFVVNVVSRVLVTDRYFTYIYVPKWNIASSLKCHFFARVKFVVFWKPY